MTEDSDPRIYDVEIVWRDAGFEMQISVDDWMEMVEKDFTSFEVIRGTFRTNRETAKERLREAWTEVGSEEQSERELDSDVPRIQLKNPPLEWQEDPGEAVQFFEVYNTLLARMGLHALTEQEIQAHQNLLESGHHKPVVVRQSAFIEEYLTLLSQMALQEYKGGVLSSKEMDLIESMGHTDRIRLSHLLGVINEEEHAILQEMASWRNNVAHTAWSEFDEQEESQIESTARRVLTFLEDQLQKSEAHFQDVDDVEPTEDFIGFNALDLDLQLLQLSVLTAVDELGGNAELSEIQTVLGEDRELVEKRCNRMVAVGYLDKSNGGYRLTGYGLDFIEDEGP